MSSNIKNIKPKIHGITCINCCKKIEKTLSDTQGILKVSISYETRIADITYNEELITTEKIYSVISKAGYEVKDKHQSKFSSAIRIAIIMLIIIFSYVILQKFGILNFLLQVIWLTAVWDMECFFLSV